jgi:multidrug efflux pump subunit AcrB
MRDSELRQQQQRPCAIHPVISSFIAVYAFGFTSNFMTMMALSLCIGLLIDDAIVVRENIVRHLGMGKDHHQAAREGTDEIGLAVMAPTFAICAVFVPVCSWAASSASSSFRLA